MSSDSSSDSENEDYSKFAEAAIEVPLTHYSNGTSNGKTNGKGITTNVPSKPSLRNTETTEASENELQVTPEFRTFVAKKLASKIDSELEVLNSTSLKPCNSTTTSEEELDFHLFSTSRPSTLPKESATRGRKRIQSSSSSDSEDEFAALASVAVTGDFILKHSEIRPELRTDNSKNESPTQASAENITSTRTTGDKSGDKQTTKKKQKKKKQHVKLDTGNKLPSSLHSTKQCSDSHTAGDESNDKQSKKKKKHAEPDTGNKLPSSLHSTQQCLDSHIAKKKKKKKKAKLDSVELDNEKYI